MEFMRHHMRIVLRIGEVALSVAVFLSCAGLLSCGTTQGQDPTTQDRHLSDSQARIQGQLQRS